MASDAIPPNLLERFFAAVELFTSREENREDPATAENELINKNIIKSPATTFGGNPPVTSSLQTGEKDRARSIGLILAKAFYDFNQTKKADTKEGTKVSPIKAKATELSIGKTSKEKKSGEVEGGGLFGEGGPLSGVMDVVDFIDDIRDLRKAWKNRRGRGIPRSRGRGIPTPRGRVPRLPPIPQGRVSNIPPISRPNIPGRQILTPPTSPPIRRLPPVPRAPSVPSMPKPPSGVGRVGRLLSRIPGVSKLAAGGAAAAGATGMLPKAGGVARALPGAGNVLRMGGAAGKAIPLAALGLDIGTTVSKFSSEEGRADLRKTGEEHDIFKDPLKVLSNSLFRPIETMSGVTLQMKDMFDSMKRAKESEAALKVAEEKSKQKTEERMSKFDVDKSGKIDTAERLRMYKEQKKSGTVEDERGKRWRYSAKEDKLLSADGNEALTMEEFLKKNYIKPVPEPKALEPEKGKAPEKPVEMPPQPIEPPLIQPPVFAQQQPPAPVPIPAQPSPVPVPSVSVKPELNLDSQNSLIIAQTHILGEMLNISRQQLLTTKNQKPSNVSVGSPINAVNVGDVRNKSEVTGDPRMFYAQSPYNLLPT